MGILNFSGPLPVAISFQWKSETVANALTAAAAPRRHILANEAVFELTVSGTAGGHRTLLRHEATPAHRSYDPTLHMYTTSPVDGAELERLLDPTSRATFTVDLRFTLSTFFDALLAQMTRTENDLHSLAHPDDPTAILRTFEPEAPDDQVDLVYHAETHTIRAVPCTLVDLDVKPQAFPYPPAVKLLFEIDFQTGIDAVRREAMRKLIAMDWSRLARDGRTSTPLPTHVEIWRDNVLVFLANQTDMRRAERFRTTIASRHAHKRPRKLAHDLREDLDLHIVAANHWDETREHPRTERYQALLSDLLGSLHHSQSPASPTYLSRELARIYQLDLDQRAAMTLQYGTGYCGEHTDASFSILRTIMATPGNHLDSIVLCGNANIDHGFVLCNLSVTRVIATTVTSPANTRLAPGAEIKVFNLREALAAYSARHVFVVDPYLDRSWSSATAEGLLRSLNSNKKQKRGKDTDFLLFQRQFPDPPGFAIEDIRDRPVAERMALVKNV